MNIEDVDTIERWWVEKSRVNFFAYRRYMRGQKFLYNWFIKSLSIALQKFYVDYTLGKRPILIITCPPQHGKTWGVEDLIPWIAGIDPDLRMVYASFSDPLGVRCNAAVQRALTSDKYSKIFPDTTINSKNVVTLSDTYKRNSSLIEFINKDGSFRNTTVEGAITGETMDIGFIDDPFKGRKEANSKTIRDSVWNWYLDDFGTRFADLSGHIITMTRWHKDDMVGRLLKDKPKNTTVFKYQALAEKDEEHRKIGNPLFPELKSKEFLEEKKKRLLGSSWSALYQGSPIQDGGNIVNVDWFKWWDALPEMRFTYAVADTAQKKNNWNDFTVMQLWGMGVDGNIYLLDMKYKRLKAPELRREAKIFYHKHNHNRYGGMFRGMCIEDKSSGIGLIQDMEEENLKVYPIPRTVDKVERTYNAAPEVKAGKVYLNVSIPDIDKVKDQAEEFPNGAFDDAWDCTMNGIEVAFIYPEILHTGIFVA